MWLSFVPVAFPFDSQDFETVLEDYLNSLLGTVLLDRQFIGTSATTTLPSQSADDSTSTLEYQSTITATFRDSTITSSEFQAAAASLSTVPLVFAIFEIGDDFAEVQAEAFTATYTAQ